MFQKFFKQFRLQQSPEEVNREFDLVNAGFDQVSQAIKGISLTPGPAGPTGAAGATGATGATGPQGPPGGGTLDIYLDYGDQSGDGDLTPTVDPDTHDGAFFLRQDTNKTVQHASSGSPGAHWEHIVIGSYSNWELDLFVFSCALTGSSPTLTVSVTKNASPVTAGTTANLDGLTNQVMRVTGTGTSWVGGGATPDKVGLLVTITNMTSGFLQMTGHLRLS